MRTKPISHQAVVEAFRQEADPDIAEHSSRFFKTGKGEYGEGDWFLGIRVPITRIYARQYREAPLSVVRSLLKSKFHEERLLAVIMLADKFKKGDAGDRKTIYELYMGHTRYINNWDIVDASAHLIAGPYLQDKSKEKLYSFARSGSLWERRIAIMATFHYIRCNEFDTALEISELLVHDTEDLIHKAVGWMLREIGKRDLKTEERFLKKHLKGMPRTMLRYAIERFPEDKRKAYLSSGVTGCARQ
jgi:3-methyladenine DNA glycosylase AlkD